MLEHARSGAALDRGEEDPEAIPAAVFRAALLRAHRLHMAREQNGNAHDMSEEAEAGAILEAETAVEIHEIHHMMRGYLEALRNTPSG